MLSEWMMSAPEDLEDYLLVPCPKGTRVTLSVGEFIEFKLKSSSILFSSFSADKPSTISEIHYKNGLHMLDFKTNLPNDTILDCIYSKSNNTIYILDVLMYAGRDVVNCDTAFRRFWIKSKFIEDEIRSYDTTIKLKTILDFDFTNSHSIYEVFQKYPMFDDGGKLDGFLFYHKESSYTYGETPLVLWLFPFMIDEVLTMFRVNPKYNHDKPLNYTNYLDYIKEFNEKLKKKKNRKGQKSQKMEVEVSKIPHKKVDEDFTEEINEDEMEKIINLEKFGGDV